MNIYQEQIANASIPIFVGLFIFLIVNLILINKYGFSILDLLKQGWYLSMPYCKIEYYKDGKTKSIETKGWFIDYKINIENSDSKG